MQYIRHNRVDIPDTDRPDQDHDSAGQEAEPVRTNAPSVRPGSHASTKLRRFARARVVPVAVIAARLLGTMILDLVLTRQITVTNDLDTDARLTGCYEPSFVRHPAHWLDSSHLVVHLESGELRSFESGGDTCNVYVGDSFFGCLKVDRVSKPRSFRLSQSKPLAGSRGDAGFSSENDPCNQHDSGD